MKHLVVIECHNELWCANVNMEHVNILWLLHTDDFAFFVATWYDYDDVIFVYIFIGA